MTTPDTPLPAQLARAEAFRALHAGPAGFVIPNPWNPGSARLLASLGFQALATTSAGHSFSLGRPDHGVDRDGLADHLRAICAATRLPVSADLGNGGGDDADSVASAITQAAQAGVVGGSIEDTRPRGRDPVYELAHSVDRVRAAVAAARALPFPFTLTARADNFFVGKPDLADTIARLQAYQEAGADVLFAPGLARREDIATVLREVDRPLNVLAGVPGMALTTAELWDMGVRRISVGALLARAAMGELLRAATELRDAGTTAFAAQAVSGADLTRSFRAAP